MPFVIPLRWPGHPIGLILAPWTTASTQVAPLEHYLFLAGCLPNWPAHLPCSDPRAGAQAAVGPDSTQRAQPLADLLYCLPNCPAPHLPSSGPQVRKLLSVQNCNLVVRLCVRELALPNLVNIGGLDLAQVGNKEDPCSTSQVQSIGRTACDRTAGWVHTL